jgi:hypothetical protein
MIYTRKTRIFKIGVVIDVKPVPVIDVKIVFLTIFNERIINDINNYYHYHYLYFYIDKICFNFY